MSKYVVKRKDVCAGRLSQGMKITYNTCDENLGEFIELNYAEHFLFSAGIVCRGMLFNVNENGLANDLIYTTPTNYMIEGIRPKINVESEFIINNYVELEEVLKYLKYGVDLTQKDLYQIFRKLITNRWWLEHHRELFGWKKYSADCYNNGGVETIPMNIYDNLSAINYFKTGKPYKEEPGYSLIKKIK